MDSLGRESREPLTAPKPWLRGSQHCQDLLGCIRSWIRIKGHIKKTISRITSRLTPSSKTTKLPAANFKGPGTESYTVSHAILPNYYAKPKYLVTGSFLPFTTPYNPIAPSEIRHKKPYAFILRFFGPLA